MLEWLRIGWIEWIWWFWGIKPNSQLKQKSPETQQYMTPIETTSTPRIDAIWQQNMMSSATGGRIWGFADTSTMLDRQIEDQKKKFITPKLDFMKWFSWMDGITRPAINPTITTDKFAKWFWEEFRAEPEKFQDSFMQNLLWKQTELWQQANKLVADKFQTQQIKWKAKIESNKKESELVKKLMSWEMQDRESVTQEYPEFADKIDTYMELSNNLGSIKNIKEFEKKYPDVSKKVWYDNNKRTFDKWTTIFDVEAVTDSPLTQLEQEQAIQAKEAWYEMEDIQKEIAKQRTKIGIMEKAIWKKSEWLINDIWDSLGLTDVEQIKGTKEYYDELKNLYERETKSPYIEPLMKSRSMLELTDKQKEIVKDEPQMEWILRFWNIIRQWLAFWVNLWPAVINLAIFASEFVKNPKWTILQFKQIPDVLSNYVNESLDNIDQKAAEWWAMWALEWVLEVIDDTQMFLAENPDIIIAPEAMLNKGWVVKALTKLGIDNVWEIANKIKIPVSEWEVAKTITKLDANTLNLIDKSIKPTVAWKQSAADLVKFQENVVKSVDNIIQNKDNLKFTDELWQTIEWKTPESLQQFSEAIWQTKDSIFQQYNSLAKEAWKTVDVPLDNIVKELDWIINNQLLDISAPWLRKYAENMKKTVAKINKLWVEQSQQLLQQLNAKLKAFYKNPNPNDIWKNMVDVLISNNLRQWLDDSILKALWDNQYGNLKSKYWELVSIEKEVAKRALIEARRNNKSLLDFTDIFSAWDVIWWLAWWQFWLVAKWLIQKGIKEYFKFLDNPNTNIKKLFKKVEEWKIDIESLRKTKNLEKVEANLEKAKEVKLEKPKEPWLSNLGKTKPKTMNESIPQNKVILKAPEEPLIAEARKYKSAEEFIDSKLQKQEYRSAHQLKLWDSITADSIDIGKLKEQIRARRWYLSNDTIKWLKKLEKLQGNPEKEITIYRASPKKWLNDGDWVTIDRVYANDIKNQNWWKVYSYAAKVWDLRFPIDTDTLPSLAMESTFSFSPETSKLKKIREEANKKWLSNLWETKNKPAVKLQDNYNIEIKNWKLEQFDWTPVEKIWELLSDKKIANDYNNIVKTLKKYSNNWDNTSYKEIVNFIESDSFKKIQLFQIEKLKKKYWDKITLYRGTKNKNETAKLLSFTEDINVAKKFAKELDWEVIKKSFNIEDISYHPSVYNFWKLGEKEVIVFNNKWLSNLWKTDFNKPATTGLPKSVELSYNKSNNPNKIDITIYKGVWVKDKINTPWAWTNYSFYSNDINRAKSYTPDNNIIEKNIILDKKDVKIIDSNWINWYSKVDNNGNIIEWMERIWKNNYVNYNNDLAKKEWYKAVIYQWINDNWPHWRPSKLPKSADDIVLL